MKTSKSKTALRVLAVSLVLLGAAFQSHVAEADCTVSGTGVTATCSGDSGQCRLDGIISEPVFCSGNQVAVQFKKVSRD